MKRSFKEIMLLARIWLMACRCHDLSIVVKHCNQTPSANKEVRKIWEERYNDLSAKDIKRRLNDMTFIEVLGAYSDERHTEAGTLLKARITELYTTMVSTTAEEALYAYENTWGLGVVQKYFWDEYIRLTKAKAQNCTSLKEARENGLNGDYYSEVKAIWEARADELYLQDALERSPLCTIADDALGEQKRCGSERGRKVWEKRFIELSDKEASAASEACESTELALKKYRTTIEHSLARDIWGARLTVLITRKLKKVEHSLEVVAMYPAMQKCEPALQQLNIRYMELILDESV